MEGEEGVYGERKIGRKEEEEGGRGGKKGEGKRRMGDCTKH